MLSSRLQRTIARPVAVRGVGFWSGKPAQVEFRPAAVGTGITFVRVDLDYNARVPAQVQYRLDVPRRTNLRCGQVQVDMVEHIMAALAGLQIDNCEVAVDSVEMPGCDGSSRAFVEALDDAGIQEQQETVTQLQVTETIRLTSGDSWIEARPVANEDYRVEFQLNYPHASVIGRQSISIDVTPDTFRHELSACRTFVLQEEAESLIRQGLGTHVTPRDLLIFGEQGPIDNHLRFNNECARHKALDLIGDLALLGKQIVGHIVAYRSSHQLNAALASELQTQFSEAIPLKASA